MNTTVELLKLTPDEVTKLNKMSPLRIILAPSVDGSLNGYCENSFSMSWEKDRAYVYWSGTAYSNFGTVHQIDAIEDALAHHKSLEGSTIYDPLSDDCPVTINLKRWLNATSKYERRNAQFTI